jgi:Dolichyl-phosphate-mannose-protein mannosyltransferase
VSADHLSVDPATTSTPLRGPALRERAARLQVAAATRPATLAITLEGAILAFAMVMGTILRLWNINEVGLNSDEAVYAGQAGAIANVDSIEPYFSAFRAHPLLFQTVLSFAFKLGAIDLWGRLFAATIGIATIVLVYKLGEHLYGRRVGAIAALFMALMPYHVLVTRQILLDGPMTFFATLTLYMIARYADNRRPAFLYAAAMAMAMAALSKETSLVLMGAVYAFFALAPDVRLKVEHAVRACVLLGLALATFPLSLQLAGKADTGGNYLAWQLFRRPNHEWTFYPTTVPEAIGWAVIAAAVAEIWLLRRERTWKDTLLLCWIAVPVAFFQVWPVKGFQYLLPIAPAVAILAAHAFARWSHSGAVLARSRSTKRPLVTGRWFAAVALPITALTLLISSIDRIDPSGEGKLLAGSGGLQGGRETGEWVDDHVPQCTRIMTVGPSMANVIQFYGHRKAYGLSVSPNPLNRNPAYEPIANPDQKIRTNELQYVVWDAYSASRSKFFSRSIVRYADRYHGRLVHTESVTVKSASGAKVRKPVIQIYSVRP